MTLTLALTTISTTFVVQAMQWVCVCVCVCVRARVDNNFWKMTFDADI